MCPAVRSGPARITTSPLAEEVAIGDLRCLATRHVKLFEASYIIATRGCLLSVYKHVIYVMTRRPLHPVMNIDVFVRSVMFAQMREFIGIVGVDETSRNEWTSGSY